MASRKSRKVRIQRVIDGDSLEVKYAGWFSFLRRPFPVRLYGIDAPELSQPYGRQAREQLASLVRRGGIRMDTMATDRYGRTVGLLYPGRRGREPINVAMVRSGMAYWYRRYGGRDLGFPEAEAEAISKRRGVWKNGRRARRPWDYRADIRRARERRRWRRRFFTRLVIAGVVLIVLAAVLLVRGWLG
ncbi:MAG: thermonuclease family protein [Chloroflexota bacterium]|nr:thermonuclease family protein [Chloroflexota bacterium]MDE2682650.1 thermonuclease family protein [Chloroflexota bacterium]